MPLPNITPRKGWKSCNALSINHSPTGGSRVRIPHYKSKKKKKMEPLFINSSCQGTCAEKKNSNTNLWKKLTKVQKNDAQKVSSALRKHQKKNSSDSTLIINTVSKNPLIKVSQRGP